MKPSPALPVIVSAFGGLLASASLMADTPPPAPAIDPGNEVSPLEITAAGSLSASSGNSESLSSGLQAMATWVGDNQEMVVGLDYFYGENESVTTTDSLRAFGDYRWTVNDRTYVGVTADYLTDSIADIDYRTNVLPKVGYDFIKSDRMTFSLEGGLGYLWEQKGGINDHYVAAMLGQRFKYKLTDRTNLWQTAGFVPELGDFTNYRAEVELGLTTRLSKFWALRFSGRTTYDSTPAADTESSDLMVMTAIEYAFGGFKPKSTAKKRRTLYKTPAKAKAVKMGWDSSAGAGLTVNNGNSNTVAIIGSYDTTFRAPVNEFFFDVDASYSKDDVSTTLQKVTSDAKYKHLLGDRVYVGANFGFLHDDVAAIDYRMTPTALAGVYLLKNDDMTFSLDAGPGYTFDSVGGMTDRYLSIFAGQRFTWEIVDGVTFKQSLAAVTDASDTGNYHIDGSAKLDIRLIGNLMLRSSLTLTHLNQPADGRDKSDLLLTGGFAYRF